MVDIDEYVTMIFVYEWIVNLIVVWLFVFGSVFGFREYVVKKYLMVNLI